jgi:hypothetical protein
MKNKSHQGEVTYKREKKEVKVDMVDTKMNI